MPPLAVDWTEADDAAALDTSGSGMASTLLDDYMQRQADAVPVPLHLPPEPPEVQEEDGQQFLQALASCTTLKCVKEAHRLPRSPKQFNYPHFIIAGFQKSATTSTHV